MKKKYLLALTLASGVALMTACNNNSENIVETGAGNITKDEFYEVLKERYGQGTLKELVYQQVLSDKYEVTEEEIEDAVNQFKNYYGESFPMWLMQMNMTEEELREVLQFQILQEKPAMQDIEATDEDILEQYNMVSKNVTARHIIVEAEETANEVLEKLNNGEKFEDLAKEYNIDPTSENGGDLGELDPNSIDQDFAKAAFKLEENETSGVVKSKFGYHIIQATKVTPKEDVESLESMKEELKRRVIQGKLTNEVIQAAIDKELEEANVKINDDDLKDIFSKE